VKAEAQVNAAWDGKTGIYRTSSQGLILAAFLGVSKEDVQLILGGNIARLLGSDW